MFLLQVIEYIHALNTIKVFCWKDPITFLFLIVIICFRFCIVLFWFCIGLWMGYISITNIKIPNFPNYNFFLISRFFFPLSICYYCVSYFRVRTHLVMSTPYYSCLISFNILPQSGVMIWYNFIEIAIVNFQIFTRSVHTLIWASKMVHYLGSL